MATLIAVYTSKGCVGRCDAKCYSASTPDCDCICGGANHGCGKDKAIEQTRDMVETWVEEYKKVKGLNSKPGVRTLLGDCLDEQLSLF